MGQANYPSFPLPVNANEEAENGTTRSRYSVSRKKSLKKEILQPQAVTQCVPNAMELIVNEY
jgi:hypothetical protein